MTEAKKQSTKKPAQKSAAKTGANKINATKASTAKTSANKANAAKASTTKTSANKKSTRKSASTKITVTKVSAKNATKTSATPKAQNQVIDSFTIKNDRKKTVAGETGLELSDLEARVENFESRETAKTAKDRKPTKRKKNTKGTSKTRKIFSVILSTIFGVSFVALCAMIIVLNMVPTHYLILGIGVLGVLAVGIIFLMCRQKTKLGLRIPLWIIAAVFSLVNIFGVTYLNKTFNFFDNLKGQEYLTEKYYVIVNKGSSFQKIEDLKDKTIATFDEGIEIYQDALKQLEAKVNAKIEKVDSISALPTSLTNHSADAILLSAVHKDFIEEDGNSFSDSTRVIYTIEIKVKAETGANHPEIDVTSEPFTVLISGSDAYGTISDRSRSDVNMLVVVNPTTHEILLISIPRDYYVQLHGTTGSRDKLTHAGIYGVQMSANTIGDLLDTKIDYYVKVNFSTVVNIVDTIGGIEVYSDQQFVPWTNRNITIPKGNVHMDGAMALAFARERKSYATGDRHRVQNQQDVLKAIIKKVTGSTVILTKYGEILDDVSSTLETNIGKDEISNLIKLQLQDMPTWQIGEYSLNGSDSHNVTYSMGQQMLYVMEPDQTTVDTARDYIKGVLEGKSLSELGISKNN